MYDDLARSQNPAPLEWFVVHAVIPSILVTLALHVHPTIQSAPQLPAYAEFVWLPVIEEPSVPGGIEGYVRLKALVDSRGRVSRSSIVTLHATDSRFVLPAQKALIQAVFLPAGAAGVRIGYWVTITIAFRAPFGGYTLGIQSKERHATGI